MAEGSHHDILRRMAGMQESSGAAGGLTTSRAVRLVLAKVAQDAAGLPLTVSSVAEACDTLDGTLAALPQDLMLVRLERHGKPVGLIALDHELRAAVIEVATTGNLQPQGAEARAPTVTDRHLCEPLIAGFLAQFPDAVRGTPLDGWADGAAGGLRFADTRVAGLVLDDGAYRTVQMTVQLGQTDRQGLLVLVLPLPVVRVSDPVPVAPSIDWGSAFTAAISAAPACLDAQLHRFSLPLSVVEGLKVGVTLPLTGCSVASVVLRDPQGRSVARARLGQSGGMRAVRLETPPALDLKELPANRAPSDPPMVAMQEIADDVMETGAVPAPMIGTDQAANEQRG